MRPVALLARLNEIDLAVDASRARLAEIAQGLKEPAGLPRARAAFAAAQTELAACREVQAQRETDQRRVADHLAAAEKGLYSGKTKSPKELESAERDVQQLHRQLAHADDELLDAMVATEAAAALADARAAELATLAADWQGTRARLSAELPRVKARLAQEQAHQARQRHEVRDDLLVIYDALRPRKAGRAVTPLDGEECSACGVAVPPTKLEQVRDGDEIIYCGNCWRILWDPGE